MYSPYDNHHSNKNMPFSLASYQPRVDAGEGVLLDADLNEWRESLLFARNWQQDHMS